MREVRIYKYISGGDGYHPVAIVKATSLVAAMKQHDPKAEYEGNPQGPGKGKRFSTRTDTYIAEFVQ